MISVGVRERGKVIEERRRSVHGEPKFNEDSVYCTQFQIQGAELCTDEPKA